ncbi:hypothetical protein [Imhoffiella purpurea]|uniref:hypothetical protein n=1 Tax=Imhoffiella purpurea TaxID=1249627 RepID=UPI0012FE76C3|nr:hypothetical protein [Imhoffiella purpurea]
MAKPVLVLENQGLASVTKPSAGQLDQTMIKASKLSRQHPWQDRVAQSSHSANEHSEYGAIKDFPILFIEYFGMAFAYDPTRSSAEIGDVD